MTKIVPAVLVRTKEEYSTRLSIIRQLTNRFQLDVIDGEYVDNKTIQLEQIGRLTDTRMDVHLMVKSPKPFVERCIALNANKIIMQFECGEDLMPFIERIKKSGLNAGVAINPETKLSKLKPFTDLLNHVLIMGYSAGFAGQKLDPMVFDRLTEVRDMFPFAEVGLDGGVNLSNAKKVLQAGFDVVNINSAIFDTEDPLSSYMKFLEYTL
jgi:ribulose-phosphate 3-epimerase